MRQTLVIAVLPVLVALGGCSSDEPDATPTPDTEADSCASLTSTS